MKCAICKLEIGKKQKTARCPHCLSFFHEEHINEWLEKENKCPVCFREIKSPYNITSLTKIEPIEVIDSKKYSNIIDIYENLGLQSLSRNIIFQFIEENKNFGQYVINDSRTCYILRKNNYFPATFNGEIIPMSIGLGILSIIALIGSILSHIILNPYLFAIILSIIEVLFSIYLVVYSVIVSRMLSNRWIALEFNREIIRIAFKGSKIFSESEKIIPIEEITDFKINKTMWVSNEEEENEESDKIKMTLYLTIKTLNHKKYSIGEVYYDTLENIQEYEKNLENFLKKNYNKPISIIETRYRKRKMTKEKIYLLLMVINFLLFFVILVIITSKIS